MTVKYAEAIDKTKIEELWRYSFNDTEDFIHYYFDNRYKAENTIVYKDEKVKAALQMNPYKLGINGETEPVSYIIGISVFPEHRGKGLTTELLKSSLTEEYNKGHSVSLLMPINTPLYTRYGYQNCINLYSYNISLSDIEFKKTDHTVRRLSDTSSEDFIALTKIYDDKSQEWDIYLRKDEGYFIELYKETKSESGEIFIVYNEKSEPKGYMVFYPKFEPMETGFVREMIALDKDALNCLFNTVKSHFTQIKKIVVYQPAVNPISAYFDYNNKIDIQIKPFMMARIVNVKKVIEKIFSSVDTCDLILYKFQNSKSAEEEIRIFIDIEDSLIENNNKTFCLNFGKNDHNGSARSSSFNLTVHERSSKNPVSDESFLIKMDIGTLSQLYFGIEDLNIMLFNEKIRTKNCDVDLLKTLFPKKKSYINEYI